MATNPIPGSGGLPLDPRSTSQTTSQQKTSRSDDLNGISRNGRDARTTEQAEEKSRTSGEKLEISKEAQDLLKLKELMNAGRKAMDNEPDVRAERVREVKQRLRSGVYQTQGIRDELAHRLTSILRGLPLDEED